MDGRHPRRNAATKSLVKTATTTKRWNERKNKRKNPHVNFSTKRMRTTRKMMTKKEGEKVLLISQKKMQMKTERGEIKVKNETIPKK